LVFAAAAAAAVVVVVLRILSFILLLLLLLFVFFCVSLFSASLLGLTSDDPHEKLDLLQQLLTSDGGTGWMHESYDVDNPKTFTRSWYDYSSSKLSFRISFFFRFLFPHL
jgi:hypothetical protein